jgi:hypothetical protein
VLPPVGSPTIFPRFMKSKATAKSSAAENARGLVSRMTGLV